MNRSAPPAGKVKNQRMTLYEQEIKRIRSTLYANEAQIRSVIAIKSYIDNHLHEPLDLNTLSRKRHTSKFHMLRLFKRYYGTTPRQYMIDRRISRSKEHLINGMTVTETCFAVGFSSPGSFSTLFREKTGCSPLSFKKGNFEEVKSNGGSELSGVKTETNIK